MTVRTGILTLGPIAVGIALLVALAPWLNPCTGPLRFVDCVRWEESTVPNAFAPWLFCPFGVCDYFPSTLAVLLKLLVKGGVILAVGVWVARFAPGRKRLAGAGAAVATFIGFIGLTGLLYHGPAA